MEIKFAHCCGIVRLIKYYQNTDVGKQASCFRMLHSCLSIMSDRIGTSKLKSS
jgi:hypothetical protein